MTGTAYWIDDDEGTEEPWSTDPSLAAPEAVELMTLDPIGRRMVGVIGPRIEAALSRAAGLRVPITTSYGFFARLEDHGGGPLGLWFQPADATPAMHLVIEDPLGKGMGLTEVVTAPGSSCRLVVIGPLALDPSEWTPGIAQVLAIASSPLQDADLGQELVTHRSLGMDRLWVDGPLLDW